MVETQSDEILHNADKEDVCLLVVGDPFGCVSTPILGLHSITPDITRATTHTDIILRARALKIPTRVIHNASIMNAIGACGLQLYNFGQTVSLVFFTETWKPDSFYDRIKENADLGLHTLVLLDIKVKEQSDENLARCVAAPRFRCFNRSGLSSLKLGVVRSMSRHDTCPSLWLSAN